MPQIKLPDGSLRDVDNGASLAKIIIDISEGLSRVALAAKVDDKLVDLSYSVEQDINLQVITAKDKEGLAILRHSIAHLLAQAVKDLFSNVQVTIGPVIEDGFYYDFASEHNFTPEDLIRIEKRMQALVKQRLPVERKVLTRQDAIKLFDSQGEQYKVEIIKKLPVDEEISCYQQGDFIDLCRGPHVPNTKHLKVFKLMRVAGAYWQGDAKNEMLQRIYGTAWADKADLKAYLHRLDEAEKRDHRKTIKKLDLLHFQDDAPGMVFWHDKGWKIVQVIENYIRNRLSDHGYQEVKTPLMADKSLWERSGHWDKYAENMFTTQAENKDYAVKPMNCPCHVQIFNQGLKSYRDLPLRMAEFGSCHRNEVSGALHGLMRVRGFIMDDAHIFCTEQQIQSEVADFVKLVFSVYRDFGFNEVLIKLSTRPEKRIGSDEVWDKAEKALENALATQDLVWELSPGEGAFYGPKIEFSLKDCLGRVWQCGTIQVDFLMPARLQASYIAEDGSKQVPVMLHRAILGSFERFLGILLEEYANGLPAWLAPVQAVIMNITDNQHEYTQNIAKKLQKCGFRVQSDLRNEKIGFKIREHTILRTPYQLIIGDRELSEQQVSVRRCDGKDLGRMPLDAFVNVLQKDVDKRCGGIDH